MAPRKHRFLRLSRSGWPVGVLVVAALVMLATSSCSNSDNRGLIPDRSEIVVAAASDLRFAFDELGNVFTEQTGIGVTFTFGSSGQLKEQILNGAPFDVFASANEEFVRQVVEAGKAWEDTVQPYAFGRLVLRARSGLHTPGQVADLVRKEFGRIAIANPGHAPYGIAAREALVKAGVYDQVKGRLVFGENVSDVMRLVETGNVDVAIVALSLVVNDESPYELIDEQLHTALKQSLVVTRTGKNEVGARQFATFLSSDDAKEVMRSYGFEIPQGEN